MSKITDLSVQLQRLDSLSPHPGNPRTHSRAQIQEIARSILAFGFTNPILVDRKGRILAGHARAEAAKLLGLQMVPVIRLNDLSETEELAYLIADNRLAEKAGWDQEILKRDFEELSTLDVTLDLSLTGFDTVEIDQFLAIGDDQLENDSQQVELPDESYIPIAKPGDIWLLGSHRIYCGDALSIESFRLLLGNAEAQMIITDPPYNVPIDGHVCGLGAIKHDEFAMGSGEMSSAEFTDFLVNVFTNLRTFSVDGSIHYIFMDWRHAHELLSAGKEVYDEIKNICVWNKTNGGMGSFYRSKHELVFVYKHGKAPHINNFSLGEKGRYRTNVWDYPGMNSFHAERGDALRSHPTVKPTALIADAIMDCSKRGGIIVDPFAGSGTTILAAERTGRHAYCIELDPKYVDVAIHRWEKMSDGQAIRGSDGRSFTELQDEGESK